MIQNAENNIVATVTNSRETPATNVVVIITLPASFTFVSSDWSYTRVGQVFTFAVENLDAEASEVITMVVTPTTTGGFTVVASVTGSIGGGYYTKEDSMLTFVVPVGIQQVYEGRDPNPPDDPSLPAVSFPSGGGALTQWDPSEAAWF